MIDSKDGQRHHGPLEIKCAFFHESYLGHKGIKKLISSGKVMEFKIPVDDGQILDSEQKLKDGLKDELGRFFAPVQEKGTPSSSSESWEAWKALGEEFWNVSGNNPTVDDMTTILRRIIEINLERGKSLLLIRARLHPDLVDILCEKLEHWNIAILNEEDDSAKFYYWEVVREVQAVEYV